MTPSQHACLTAIRDLTVDGVAPTFQELADHLGHASKSYVHHLVNALEEQGYVRYPLGRRSRRNMEIVGAPVLCDSTIARLSIEELKSLDRRVSRALAIRQSLSQAMQEGSA